MGFTPKEKTLLDSYIKRRCNLFDCPAFHLTPSDDQFLLDSMDSVKTDGIDAAVKKFGVPSGTCNVTGREMVVNTRCKVPDRDFIDYYHDLYDKHRQ